MGANHWKFRDFVQVSIFKFFSHSVSPFIFAMKLSRDRSRARSEKPWPSIRTPSLGPPEGEHLFLRPSPTSWVDWLCPAGHAAGGES
jgi:hypothetical protein